VDFSLAVSDNGGADAKANSMIAEENQHCVVHTTNLIANGALVLAFI
jgi:hypothetical protein